MPAKLVIVGGPNEGATFNVEDDTKVTIGRGDSVNIKLEDATVSRVHCVVEYFGGVGVVKDCASKTGTKINGVAVTQQELKPLAVIGVGKSELRFLPEVQEMHEPEKPDEEARDPDELVKLSGTKLSHYDIGEVVAIGTSGVVFRAQDLKDDREVALKVYVPQFAESEEEFQRFIRAVKTMLPMRHPNLVTLYGGGKTGPYCWMAMEFVDGQSLDETIQRIGKGGKLDWKAALRVALDLSRALFYIHGEKIIHRNLSPQNILHTRQGTAMLGSLILAKALSGALAKDVTVGGELLGDVRYLAPEQAGAGGPVDSRADIYALGALFYALLTGKPPFEGKSAVQTATWILRKDPTPPRQIDPTIPKPVEQIVLKMLAKTPDDRYQSAGDLLAALEELPKF
jgi:serine/threonine protein kinase